MPDLVLYLQLLISRYLFTLLILCLFGLRDNISSPRKAAYHGSALNRYGLCTVFFPFLACVVFATLLWICPYLSLSLHNFFDSV